MSAKSQPGALHVQVTHVECCRIVELRVGIFLLFFILTISAALVLFELVVSAGLLQGADPVEVVRSWDHSPCLHNKR